MRWLKPCWHLGSCSCRLSLLGAAFHADATELLAFPGIRTASATPNLDRRALPIPPVTIRKHGVELRLFTTVTTMGTPRDVAVHELRVESFVPADAASAQWFQSRYAPAG